MGMDVGFVEEGMRSLDALVASFDFRPGVTALSTWHTPAVRGGPRQHQRHSKIDITRKPDPYESNEG